MLLHMLHAVFRPPLQARDPAPRADAIRTFLLENHVLGLCVADQDGLWAASCFYAADVDTMTLFVMTSQTTRHGRAMASRPFLAGTIAGQPRRIGEIRGVQFTALCALLEGEERDRALATYLARHPVAAAMPQTIWALHLREVKFTDNRDSFGKKTLWRRDPERL